MRNINLSDDVREIPNLIVYGPYDSQKYVHVLCILTKFSPSKLKSQKKMEIEVNKTQYIFKSSDIHYEIDLHYLELRSGMFGLNFSNI